MAKAQTMIVHTTDNRWGTTTTPPQKDRRGDGLGISTGLDVAWAAGLFEGEGSFYVCPPRAWRTRRFPVLVTAVMMTDRDVVERFARIVGVGSVSTYTRTRGDKQVWLWRVYGPKAEAVADLLVPLLGERRSSRLAEIRREIADAHQVPCEDCGEMVFATGRSVACPRCRVWRRKTRPGQRATKARRAEAA